MGQFLIDSNVVIDYLGGNLPDKSMAFVGDIVNLIPVLSIMTKIEVLGFKNSENDNDLINEFIASSIIIELTDEITDLTIKLRKGNRIKIPDAIIAATAITLNLSLITRDIKDFGSIANLMLIDPWNTNNL